MSTLLWVPDEKGAVYLAENYQLAETLFEVGLAAFSRRFPNVVDHVWGLLVSWAIKAARHDGNWVDDAFCGAATLAILRKDAHVTDALKQHLSNQLGRTKPLGAGVRELAADELRRRVKERRPSRIDGAMSQVDQTAL